jgi:hypothetical protein
MTLEALDISFKRRLQMVRTETTGVSSTQIKMRLFKFTTWLLDSPDGKAE